MAHMDEKEDKPSTDKAAGQAAQGRVDKDSSVTVKHETSRPSLATGQTSPKLNLPSWTHFKRPYLDGSPVKGSGQDRFRQVLATSNTPNPTFYIDKFVPFPSQSATRPLLNYTEAPPQTAIDKPLRSAAYGPYLPPHMQNGYAGPPGYRPGGIAKPEFYPAGAGFGAPVAPAFPAPNMNYPAATPSALPCGGPPAFQRVGSSAAPAMKSEGGRQDDKPSSNGRDASRGANQGTGRSGYRTTWTAILSAECQKRRFNPQFHEWVAPDGDFRCSVSLDGFTLYGTRGYPTATEAKQALAESAIQHVRLKPVPDGPSNKAGERLGRQAGERPGRLADATPQKRESPSLPEPRGLLEKSLMTRIQNVFGHTAGPSDEIMKDPVASRAFLEGFALGCKVQGSQSQDDANGDKNARDRSYRARSRASSSRETPSRDRSSRDLTPSARHYRPQSHSRRRSRSPERTKRPSTDRYP